MKTLMLSPLEKACLQWVSQGRTLVEIASLEGKKRHRNRTLSRAGAHLAWSSVDEGGG